ncbi:hypothetical protein SPHINGOT1_340013 [Sphingomonas sp. T1]|nr:hypothetical protein SPHINGOT1_340013 [Sphingomonas sp. T1]
MGIGTQSGGTDWAGVHRACAGSVTGEPALSTTLRAGGLPPALEAQSLGRLRALYDQPARGPGASLRLSCLRQQSDRGPSPSCRAPVERG